LIGIFRELTVGASHKGKSVKVAYEPTG